MRAPRSRYETLVKVASGGMATVYLGRAQGALGFEQLVAIKRPHAHLIEDPRFRNMLAAEAQLSARIRHANVVAIRDVEVTEDTVLLVMDYIEGGSLAEVATHLPAGDAKGSARVILRVLLDVCAGLHAAHELRDDDDDPLGLVHRDVSPQNVLVGVDGVSRVTDFGIAKCFQSSSDGTTEGVVKGKLAYMSPEQLRGEPLDRRSDIFALGIMTWELLAGERLFFATNPAVTLTRVLEREVPPLSTVAPDLGTHFDGVLARALNRDPEARFGTAAELAEALEEAAEQAGLLAGHREVARVVTEALGPVLSARRERMRALRASGRHSGSLVRSQPGGTDILTPEDFPAEVLATADFSVVRADASDARPPPVPSSGAPASRATPPPPPPAKGASSRYRAPDQRASSSSITPPPRYADETSAPIPLQKRRAPLWTAGIAAAVLAVIGAVVVIQSRPDAPEPSAPEATSDRVAAQAEERPVEGSPASTSEEAPGAGSAAEAPPDRAPSVRDAPADDAPSVPAPAKPPAARDQPRRPVRATAPASTGGDSGGAPKPAASAGGAADKPPQPDKPAGPKPAPPPSAPSAAPSASPSAPSGPAPNPYRKATESPP